MKINLTFHPCIRCLQVCPHCKLQPYDKRNRQAEAALIRLREMFPGLFDDGPEPGDPG